MESKISFYTELKVWQEARNLTKIIYGLTKQFPKDELFALTGQMRRCSISISSNIAEGCGRNSTKDSVQFFYIGRGSIYELESQLYAAFDLEYIDKEQLNQTLHNIELTRKLLNGLIKYFQSIQLQSKITPKSTS